MWKGNLPFFMDRDKLPDVEFTKEELTYLQDLLNEERSQWFNYYEACMEEGRLGDADKAYHDYKMCRVLRDKVYHMNGRDTLAPGRHPQRWWDQTHDY